MCLQHCLNLMSEGDDSMAECAKTVRAMLPMCQGLQELASQSSTHLKEFAKLCSTVCRDCQKACKKHENHHEICKRCMDSCDRCAGACDKFVAA
jgi:Cys-rich four helix bundle protein (predicted Tat secretion target)